MVQSCLLILKEGSIDKESIQYPPAILLLRDFIVPSVSFISVYYILKYLVNLEHMLCSQDKKSYRSLFLPSKSLRVGVETCRTLGISDFSKCLLNLLEMLKVDFNVY